MKYSAGSFARRAFGSYGQQASPPPVSQPVQPVMPQPTYQQPIYQPAPVAQPTLDIACYATPTKIKVGQMSTWTADVVGGVGPYRYTWNGTDGLVSNQRTASKTYFTAGTKKATITVYSADGRVATRACGVSVVVSSATAAVKGTVSQAPVQTPPPVYQGPQYYDPLTGKPLPPGVQPFPMYENPSNQSANSFFSLKNIPWGWAAFLVILVLFVTVIYLIFNKNKI